MKDSNKPYGYLAIVLHTHLPYVRHPEYEYFLEENWLYEAITDCYIPLLKVFSSLHNEGIKFRIVMSFSPPLLNMLSNELLQNRYIRHIERLIELSEKEIKRTYGDDRFNRLAVMYNQRFREAYDVFVNRFNKNIVRGFKELQDGGVLEIIPVVGTHPYLPLMKMYPRAVKAQVSIAVSEYERFFGRKPVGIWLPECGYYEGVEEILSSFGIKYFFLETHGILFGVPRHIYGVYAPIKVGSSDVYAFGRDPESSKQVWSSKEGYPGDYDYREYYRDIGFDLDYEYIKEYIHPDGIRINTGIKYYRITGGGDYKEPYDRERALRKAEIHAGNFMFNREKQVEYLAGVMKQKPIVVAPYDTELFGHWWYEGPDWLYFLLKKMDREQDNVKTIFPSEYIERYSSNVEAILPTESSWGYKGYSEVWLDGSNDWIYRHIHKATERMIYMVDRFGKITGGMERRVLNQMARELMLMQASDWPFIMKMQTMVEYAVGRIKSHILRFSELYGFLEKGKIDEKRLSYIEKIDDIFPYMDYRIYM